MQVNWDDMRTVLALVRAGTLAGAAEVLGVSYTTVSRRVQRAEGMLGHVLFERHPEGYIPTAEAHDLAAAAKQMEQQEHQLLRQLAGQDQSLTGAFTLTAPELLIQAHLAPLLLEFTNRYPEVELRVKATNDWLDLNRREADLALRISSDPGDTLVGRKLTTQRSGCFATPEIAERAAADPMAVLDWVLFSEQSKPPEAALSQYPNARVRARFDDMVALVAAARVGMGALRMPVFLGRSTPGLVPLPQVATTPYAPIWMLSHRDLQHARKVAAFKDLLVPWFKQYADLFTSL
ncbi:LysR family transcriptional regulator [Rhodobacterales bacterium 56_14_T64]|nr:LysR family transcriptional regulator [Rhodobacterales bacterium 56_14_T64]